MAGDNPMLFRMGDPHEISEGSPPNAFANYSGPGSQSTNTNTTMSDMDPRSPGPQDPALVMNVDPDDPRSTNRMAAPAVKANAQPISIYDIPAPTPKAELRKKSVDNSKKVPDSTSGAQPISVFDVPAPATKGHRRKSSLEKFSLSSLLPHRRPSVAAAEYNHFAANNMRLLQKVFTSGGYGSNILVPYEIAYFAKVFALPIPVKPAAHTGKRRLSLASAAASMISAVTKGGSTDTTDHSTSAGHERHAKPFASLLDIPKDMFLHYWEAATQVVDEESLISTIYPGNESAVEESTVPTDAGVKFLIREKVALREAVRSPYVSGLLYAVHKLHECDRFLKTTSDSSMFGANNHVKKEDAAMGTYGLTPATQRPHSPPAFPDNTATRGETTRWNAPGMFFDIALLHFLANYYMPLSNDIISAQPTLISSSGARPEGVSNTTTAATTETMPSSMHNMGPTTPLSPPLAADTSSSNSAPPDLDAPSLQPLSEYHAQIRLTPVSRCFDFDGKVSTYGAVQDSRPLMIRPSYESGIIPLSPSIPLGGPFEENKDGAWTEAYVACDGVMRKSKDLWKYM